MARTWSHSSSLTLFISGFKVKKLRYRVLGCRTANTLHIDRASLVKPFYLHLALREVAKTSRDFVDRALACGASGWFMRYDVLPVVDSIVTICTSPIALALTLALKDYLVASNWLANFNRPKYFDDNTALNQLPIICEQALIMSAGKIVPKRGDADWVWELEGTLRLKIIGLPGDMKDTRELHGMDKGGLLLVLRNLIANVKKYGVLDNFETPTLTLKVTTNKTNLFLSAYNPVGARQAAELMQFAGGDTRMPELLTPFKAVGHGAGDGLGLYHVQTMVDKANAAVKLRPPCLVTINGQQNFLVELIFPKDPIPARCFSI